jgi:hypothetical protein
MILHFESKNTISTRQDDLSITDVPWAIFSDGSHRGKRLQRINVVGNGCLLNKHPFCIFIIYQFDLNCHEFFLALDVKIGISQLGVSLYSRSFYCFVLRMSLNESEDLQITEFNIFVIGPFSTNVYVDLNRFEIEKLQSDEVEVLRFISTKPKTVKKIFKEIPKEDKEKKVHIEDIRKHVNHLQKMYFADTKEKTLGMFRGKELPYIITEKGKYKLQTIDNDRQFLSFIENMKIDTKDKYLVEDGKHYYDNLFENNILSLKEHAFLLAVIKPISEDRISFDEKTLVQEMILKENKVLLFASGIGVFSSKVNVKIDNGKRVTATDIREIIKRELGKEGSITKQLEKRISEINKKFVELADKKLGPLHNPYLRLEDDKVSKCAWLHTMYWLHQSSDDIKQNRLRDVFSVLVDQELKSASFTDRYVSYGWGRSLIVTHGNDDKATEWVDNKVKLIEIGQYFSFGFNMLDYFLTRKISELTLIGSASNNRHTNIETKIERFKSDRYATIRYLEQFRSSMNIMFQSEQSLLLDTLEHQWRIKQLEENIENKLQVIEKELSSEEQALARGKQDRLNKVAAIFTGLSVVIVISTLADKSPLSENQKFILHMQYLTEDLFILAVASIIASITYVLLKYHKMAFDKIRQNRRMHMHKKMIQKAFKRYKNDQGKGSYFLDSVKYNIEQDFYQGMLSRSHFDTLNKYLREL